MLKEVHIAYRYGSFRKWSQLLFICIVLSILHQLFCLYSCQVAKTARLSQLNRSFLLPFPTYAVHYCRLLFVNFHIEIGHHFFHSNKNSLEYSHRIGSSTLPSPVSCCPCHVMSSVASSIYKFNSTIRGKMQPWLTPFLIFVFRVLHRSSSFSF